MLIGQDIWQRVFTARSDRVAAWGGTAAGAYCLVYAVAGAVIGMATKTLHPRLADADQAFAAIVQHALPAGVSVASDRVAVAVLGVLSMALACLLGDVIAALTVAYDLLVGGLLIPVLGGLVWRRGNLQGALASMVAGGSTVLTFMVADGLLANEPIYYGLLAGLVAYVVVSLATRPTEEAVVEAWRRRLAGETRTVR